METLEELKKIAPEKLSKMLEELKKDLFKIEFEIRTAQEKDNHKRKTLRRQIARIETILGKSKSNITNNES